MRISGGLVLLMVAGASRAAAAAPADAGASCEADVTALERWMVALPHALAGRSWTGTPPRLVDRPEVGLSQVPRDSPTVVELAVDSITVEGGGTAPVADVSALRSLLDEAASRKHADAAPLTLLLAIDRDRPWADVVEVVKTAVSVGFGELELVFQESFKVAPPPSAFDGERARILHDDDPFSRLRSAALLTQKVLQPCAPALKVFGRMAGVAPEEKMGLLVKEMPPALRACSCAAPPTDVMTALWLLQSPGRDSVIRRSYVGARVTLAEAGQPATVVRARRSERWSRVFPKALRAAASDGGRPMRFEIAPH